MNKLIFTDVDEDNKELAINLQAQIFPDEKSPKQVIDGIKTNNPKNYIVYNNETPVGIVGYYRDENIPNHLFINWFGVLHEFRGNGYGEQILKWLIELCKKEKEQYLTTYTDKVVNFESVELYKKLGFYVKDYANKEDIAKFNSLGVGNNYVACLYKLKDCELFNFEKLYLKIYDDLIDMVH